MKVNQNDNSLVKIDCGEITSWVILKYRKLRKMKKLSDKYNLALIHPEIANQWHPTKNGELLPTNIAPGSSKKIWWQCDKNKEHVWLTTISSRSAGAGCPYCSGRKPDNKNNLAVINPNLAEQWHPTKNGKLKPEDFTAKSGKKVWWRCKKVSSHHWQATIANRSNGNNCPVCDNKKVDETNNLARTHPELVKEFHPTKNIISPKDLVAGSSRKVWWQCKKSPEHEWQAHVSNRTGKHSGCPFCSNQSSAPELRLYAELLSVFSDVQSRRKINGEEVDIYLPNLKIGIEYDGVRYHLEKRSRDEIKNQKLRDFGVELFRIRERPLEKICTSDVLVSSRAFLKSDIDNLLLSISKKNPAIKNIISRYLENSKFLADEKYQYFLSFLPNPIPEHSLEQKNPQLCEEWDYEVNVPLKPSNFTVSSAKKVSWICRKNPSHKWKARIASRNAGRGCPICSNQLVSEDNSLATLRPDLIFEWNYEKNKNITPEGLVPGSAKKVWWKCSKGPDHEWKAAVLTRARGGGCPFCANQKVSITNNLSKTHPHLKEEWHPEKNGSLTPDKIIAGSHKRVWWKCSKGPDHEWRAPVGDRKIGNGCPFCAGKRVSITNSLSNDLSVSKEWHPTKNGLTTPKDVTLGSTKKVWWKCPNGADHEWQASVSDRLRKGNGCPFCSNKKVSEANSLVSLYPMAKNLWHPIKNGELTPANVVAGSMKKVWWKCSKGLDHEWQAPVSNFKNGIGCPFCSGRKPSQTNSLMSLYPKVAAEWHPEKNGLLTPDKIVAGSHKKVWFQCAVNNSHVWQTTLKNRTTKKRPTGCPYCAGKVKQN